MPWLSPPKGATVCADSDCACDTAARKSTRGTLVLHEIHLACLASRLQKSDGHSPLGGRVERLRPRPLRGTRSGRRHISYTSAEDVPRHCQEPAHHCPPDTVDVEVGRSADALTHLCSETTLTETEHLSRVRVAVRLEIDSSGRGGECICMCVAMRVGVVL